MIAEDRFHQCDTLFFSEFLNDDGQQSVQPGTYFCRIGVLDKLLNQISLEILTQASSPSSDSVILASSTSNFSTRSRNASTSL